MDVYLLFPLLNGLTLNKNFVHFLFPIKMHVYLRDFSWVGAIDCEIDKQGRFLISSNLREFAELTKDVVIIGMDSRIEIWSKEKWQKCDEDISADDIAAKMEMLGI